MKRRGVLGFLAGGAVAGPSMAKAAVVQGMESLSIGGTAGGISGGIEMGAQAGLNYAKQGLVPDEYSDPSYWPRKEIADFLGMSADEMERQRLETHVSMLDPDLSAMRAVSLDSKIRMQRDRNFRRNRENHLSYLRRDLANALKRLVS